MPPVQLYTDVALGVAIPSRNARGRIARLASTVDAVLTNHGYPPVIERLLAEALTLTALLGALLKEPEGQLTLQAQTEGGAIDLMVCDYLRGELRGYVRHDAEKLAELPAEPTLQQLFGKGFLAITFDQPVSEERYQGIVPLEGRNLAEAAQSYFAQSEQIPSLVRLAAEKRDRHWVGAGCCCSICRRARRAASGCTRGSITPTGRTSRFLGGSLKPDELTDPELPLDDLIWRLFHEEEEVRTLPAIALGRGCRCDPDYVRSVIARFPADEREAMVGDDGVIRVDCAFCSSSFAIQPSELA